MIYKYFFVHYEIMLYHSWQIMNSDTRIKNKGSSVLKNQKVNPSNLCVILAKYFIIRCATKRKGTTCNAKKSNAMKIYPKISL